MKRLYCLLFFIILYFITISAAIINIPENYLFIQEGINAASEGDTVMVQPGTYYENIDFDGKDITVASKFLISADTSYISQTIIDGSQNGSVVTFENGETSEAKLSGFTIRNGSGTLHTTSKGYGGGILCNNYSNPTLTNLIITKNICDSGGGIFCENYASPKIMNTTISNNTAYDDGGGILCGTGACPTISDVIIYGNTCYDKGAGICLGHVGDSTDIIVTNTLIYDNTAHEKGGGIYFAKSTSTLDKVTIAYNTSTYSGIYCTESTVDISNSIIWGNNNQQICLYNQGFININYSNIQDSWEGDDNINQNPLFVDPENDDYHLLAESPCIDAGDPESPLDPDGTIVDMGAYYFHQYDPVYLEIGTEYACNGYDVFVPVSISGNYSPLISAEFTFSGYQTGLVFNDIILENSLAGEAGWIYTVNETDTGLITAFAGSEEICDNGILFWIKFHVVSELGFIPINFADAVLNTGNIQTILTNGGVEIVAPSFGDVDLNGIVQAYDASQILQYLVDYIDLAELQQFYADVTLDNTISALDANIILQYVAGTINELPYISENSFNASGDIVMSDQNVNAGDDVKLPINLTNPDNIYSFELEVEFDPNLITFEGIEYNTLRENFITENNLVGNVIHIIGTGFDPINEESSLANLCFTVSNDFDTDSTVVKVKQLRWNEEDIKYNCTQATLMCPTEIDSDIQKVQNVLMQNYPNPFNPTTTIKYNISSEADVTLTIYNTKGQLIRSLVNESQNAGEYSIEWNGTDENNKPVSSGIYFYKISTNSKDSNYSSIKKMILLK